MVMAMVKSCYCPLCDKAFLILQNRSRITHCPDCGHHLNLKPQVIDIVANEPHQVCEVICLRCLKRWIAVYPEKTLLKELECSCGEVGYVIKTGQEMEDYDDV